MTTTATTGALDWPHKQGTHTLLVADTVDECRSRTATWVGGELARGAKVYYKGWLGEGERPDEHWIVGPTGAPGAWRAFGTGQLEFLDFRTVVERCGGTTAGLFQLQTDEVRRAITDGWTSVAMSQESTCRPMADEAEAAEFAAQERGYDVMSDRWPLRTLCQLTIEQENVSAIWQSLSVHHREVSEGQWGATRQDGRWHLRGELDAHVARRFGAALYGALLAARRAPGGPDLHIDLAAVMFMDFTCAKTLVVTADSAAREQRIVLHRTDSMFRYVIIAAGRPRSVLFDHEVGTL